jgi:polysaccharide biosynthesis/export protein
MSYPTPTGKTAVLYKYLHFARYRSWLLSGVCFFFSVANAQTQSPTQLPSSDLGRENLSRVAASASELKTVLLKDTGLMVEVKRWVAQDATDHGQVISDSDLTNDAIFQRLESDSQFRAIATKIVQRYGYLLPIVNPDSEAGKERELLIQERVKWLAQSQEEERTAERQRRSQDYQTAKSCNSGVDQDCANEQPRSGEGQQNASPALNRTQSPDGSGESVPPSRAPQQPDRLQYAGGANAPDSTDMYSRLSPAGGMQIDASFNGLDPAMTGFSSANLPQLPYANRENDPLNSPPPNVGGDAQSAMLLGRGTDLSPTVASVGGSGIEPTDAVGSVRSPITGRSPQTGLLQPVEMTRKQSPYADIPSLYDMYLQAVTRPVSPTRFGSEVFANGSRDPQLIPMDLPVGPDYVVGPGDGLSIDLWGGVSQRFFRTVDREGRVSLPEAGPVLVSGKSLADVQQDVQQILRTQFRDVSAEVSLSRLRTIRVYEVGDVANPGAYDISSLSTPLNALFAAGGPTSRGSLRMVEHYRGSQLIQVVDLYDLLLHGVKSDMARLDNGDTVRVPPVGAQVTVEGMVRRPAIYELKNEKSLASVLELAGGLLPTAALRHIEVQRLVAHDKQTMLSLDITEISDSTEVAKKLESFEIRDGDRVRIFPIAPYNQDAIYLDGHVSRPGRYSYRENMRVTDVIGSYTDLLPEPATRYAEIIRLNAPDFHPTVESFDLAAALANPAQSPVLHPMDTIRVFSKFDFENPPEVSVWGDVRSPGTYRTPGEIRLADAVHLAGGLGPDAQMENAQVFRYQADGKFTIFSVRLSQALAGDPTENIVLQPRDRLLVHRHSDAVELATAYVQGAVARPGEYPLTTNMTVADLIQVGGGLNPSADPNTADLTHFQYGSDDQLAGRNDSISISAALASDPKSNVAIHNGDVLTIRQRPGWNDLGASITVKGEVKNPGTYGIRPGEKLSSVIERAGGFQPGAYPYGTALQRVQVRELEAKNQDQMILRVKDQEANLQLLPDTDPDKKKAKDMALVQWQTTLEQLSSNPPSGRVAIHVDSDLKHWANSSADIEVRAGDVVVIPKKPEYVMVTGEVFNPTAVGYRPGKSAQWYLSQSGGPTALANKKAIFVIRADGSVLGTKNGLWSGDSLNAPLRAGDTVVVPERAIGGGIQWQAVFLAAQVASSVASTAFIAAHY